MSQSGERVVGCDVVELSFRQEDFTALVTSVYEEMQPPSIISGRPDMALNGRMF
jgi:hypothetical protein